MDEKVLNRIFEAISICQGTDLTKLSTEEIKTLIIDLKDKKQMLNDGLSELYKNGANVIDDFYILNPIEEKIEAIDELLENIEYLNLDFSENKQENTDEVVEIEKEIEEIIDEIPEIKEEVEEIIDEIPEIEEEVEEVAHEVPEIKEEAEEIIDEIPEIEEEVEKIADETSENEGTIETNCVVDIKEIYKILHSAPLEDYTIQAEDIVERRACSNIENAIGNSVEISATLINKIEGAWKNHESKDCAVPQVDNGEEKLI